MMFGRTPESILACATLVLTVAALGSGAARAGERLQFKNGHTLTVESSREDGDWLVVKMADGSEARFPKTLVRQIDGGHEAVRGGGGGNEPSNYAGRGPRFDQLQGFREAMRENANTDVGSAAMARAGLLSEQTNAANNGQPVTVGFSYMGSGDYGRIGSNAPATVNVLDVRARNQRVRTMPGLPEYLTEGTPSAIVNGIPALPVRVAPPRGRAGASKVK